MSHPEQPLLPRHRVVPRGAALATRSVMAFGSALLWLVKLPLTMVLLLGRVVLAVCNRVLGNYVYDPSLRISRMLEILMILDAVFISWSSPFFVCFLDKIPEGSEVIEYVMCAIILANRLLLGGYIDSEDIADQTIIERTYHCLWGALEILTVIPIHFIVMLPLPFVCQYILTIASFLLRLMHVPKMFRTPSWIKLILVTIFCLHTMGCFFFLIARINSDFHKTWVSLMTTKESHILFKYLMSVYWSTTAFTTVGYGDLHAVSGTEMGYNIVSLLFCMGLSSYVMNHVQELLNSWDHKGKKLREHIRAVREFSRSNSLSQELREEMLTHLKLKGTLDVQARHGFELLSLFPNHLQSRVKASLFTEQVQKLYLFQGVSFAFVFQLIAEMEVETFESNEVIILSNEFPMKFYILWKGEVIREISQEVASTSEGTTSTSSSTHMYGELGVLCSVPQPYTFRTRTPSHLLSVNRITLMRLFEVHKEEVKILLSNILMEAFDKDLNILNNAVLKQSLRDKNVILSIEEVSKYYTIAIQDHNLNLLKLVHSFSGQDVNIAITTKQETPLHIAVGKNNIEAAIYLQESKANCDIKDLTGISPREMAKKEGSEEMKKLFDSFEV